MREREGEWERVERETVREREGEWQRVERETVREREGEWESVEGETVRDYSNHSPSLSCPVLAHCFLLHSLPLTIPLPE